jgi:hypothetical protein
MRWVNVIAIFSTYLHNRLCITSIEGLVANSLIMYPANESKNVTSFVSQFVTSDIKLIYALYFGTRTFSQSL